VRAFFTASLWAGPPRRGVVEIDDRLVMMVKPDLGRRRPDFGRCAKV